MIILTKFYIWYFFVTGGTRLKSIMDRDQFYQMGASQQGMRIPKTMPDIMSEDQKKKLASVGIGNITNMVSGFWTDFFYFGKYALNNSYLKKETLKYFISTGIKQSRTRSNTWTMQHVLSINRYFWTFTIFFLFGFLLQNDKTCLHKNLALFCSGVSQIPNNFWKLT